MVSAEKRYVIRKRRQRSHKDSNHLSFYQKFFGMLLVACLVFPTVSAKPTNPCKKTQYWIEKEDGTTECIDCQTCPPGQTASPECGNSKPLPSNTMGHCVACQLGRSFSNEHSTSVCTPCSYCTKDQVVIKNCSRQADIECGKRCYSKDRYYDASKGDCLKCSKCCNDDQDVEEDECKGKLGSQSSMICSFHSSVNRCSIKSTPKFVPQSTNESSQSSAPTMSLSSHTVTTGANASEGYRLKNITQPRVHGQFASKSNDHDDSYTLIIVTAVVLVLVLVLLIVVGMCLLWFCKSRPPKHSSVNPDGLGTCKKKRTEVHYNCGSVQVELSKPLLESDGKACTSSCQNAEKLVIKSDSKPLRDLLNSSEQEEICELLDAPICGKLPYEAIARWYGASHTRIKARFQDGKSEAVITWLVAEKPELTVGEFATVVKEKGRRTDAADKLKAFDAKATKESTDAA